MTRAGRIIEIRENYRQVAAEMSSPSAVGLAEVICTTTPIVISKLVDDWLNVSRPTALRLLESLEEDGVLEEASQGARGQRLYVAREMMEAVTGDLDGWRGGGDGKTSQAIRFGCLQACN